MCSQRAMYVACQLPCKHWHSLIGPHYVGNLPTIGYLPEDVVLEIFYFYKLACPCNSEGSWEWQREWHKLVHVCRQWRAIIFASQHRLELQLFCTPKKPITKILDLWPAFPIVVQDGPYKMDLFPDDQLTAALQQHDRICKISLRVGGPRFERISQIMQPFPLLEHLSLRSDREPVERVLPSTFLGGSAPHLRALCLDGITFPALPRLLSSACDLVKLSLLERVPSTEYISPEALVSGLSATARLKKLSLNFVRGTFRSKRLGKDTPPPSSGRIVFSTLTKISFRGRSEYLEDFVSRISAPSLEHMVISFFNQPSFKKVSQLSKFLGRVEPQRLPDLVNVTRYAHQSYSFSYPRTARTPEGIFSKFLDVSLALPIPRLEISLITHILQQISFMLTGVLTLEIETFTRRSGDNHDEDVAHWLDLLRMFNRVENILFFGDTFPGAPRALQLVSAEMAADVLPALRELTLSPTTSESREAIESFVDARKLAGLPSIRLDMIPAPGQA